MLKIATAALLLASVALPARAEVVHDWEQIDKVLASLPTVAGISLKQRLDACKIVVRHDDAQMELRTDGNRLMLLVDIPPRVATPKFRAAPQWRAAPMNLILNPRGGRPLMADGLSSVLLNDQGPLGYSDSKDC